MLKFVNASKSWSGLSRLVVVSHLNLIRNGKLVDEIDIGDAVFRVGTAAAQVAAFSDKLRY